VIGNCEHVECGHLTSCFGGNVNRSFRSRISTDIFIFSEESPALFLSLKPRGIYVGHVLYCQEDVHLATQYVCVCMCVCVCVYIYIYVCIILTINGC